MRETDPVGLAGAGLFGTKLADQIERAPKREVAIIADKACDTFVEAAVVIAKSRLDTAEALKRGERTVLQDGTALAETTVDVFVEATGQSDVTARHAYTALDASADQTLHPLWRNRERLRGNQAVFTVDDIQRVRSAVVPLRVRDAVVQYVAAR